MAIHLIVDGYNLIRQSSRLAELDQMDLQSGREALIEELVAYKKLKGHSVTVVFDGTKAPAGIQRRHRSQGIEIRFSRSGELADAVIKRMAAREQEQALVVSSDNDLVDYVRRKGGATIESKAFEERMVLAAYMDLKGTTEDESRGWKPTTRKKGPRRRLSKNRRRNRQRLAKL